MPEAVTVAILVLLLIQVPPEPVVVYNVGLPKQIWWILVMEPALGAGLTVTNCVSAMLPHEVYTV